jgi:hypothetical protein
MKKAAFLALFFAFLMVVSVVLGGAVWVCAQTDVTTFVSVKVETFPAIANRPILISYQVQLSPPYSTALSNLTLTLTLPDGTLDGTSFSTQGSGTMFIQPQNQVGNYTIQISFPGQILNSSGTSYNYLPSTSSDVTINVLPPYLNGTDVWTKKTPMPTARFELGVAAVNDKIYAIGGAATDILGTNEMYDPATDTWETMASMPTPRAAFGIAVYQNKIYCIGGTLEFYYKTGRENATGVNEVYDPQTNTWTTKTSMPTPEADPDANVVDGKIYLIYGTLNQVYDPATDSWATKASPPANEQGFVSTVANNKIYLIGGSDSYSSSNIYDPQTDNWSIGASIPNGYPGGAAATSGVLAPVRVYVFGGDNLVASADTQVYDPESDTWIMATFMPTPRGHVGVAVVNDTFYVLGGIPYYVGDPMATTEQYVPIGYGTVSSPSPSPTLTPSPTPTLPHHHLQRHHRPPRQPPPRRLQNPQSSPLHPVQPLPFPSSQKQQLAPCLCLFLFCCLVGG